MEIKNIIKKLEEENEIIDSCDELINIDYISYNSKDIKENTLFICKGLNYKEEYLKEAIERGATCYVSEKKYNANIPSIIVKNIRKATAIIAGMFYKDDLFKIGITGTKGKTTTNYFLNNIIKHHLGFKPGFLATHYFYTGKNEGDSHLTTPDSIELHRYLNEMSSENLKYVTMEVSSQAEKLDRVYGMKFNIGIFLNINEDHISSIEHKDFEDYFSCKLEFLKKCDTVIIYNGTDHFDRILDVVKDKKVITFGFQDADYIIKNIKSSGSISFELVSGMEEEKYEINMLGSFNVVNASAAIIASKIIGVKYQDILKGLIETKVSGRVNVINDFICPIVIDYAHNALSAEALYKALKESYPNKKIKVVFGCPGDKGINRRKEMGEAAGRYADYVYLTEEDRGHQTVAEICDDIISYIKKFHNNYEVIENREKAIKKALKEATEDDVIAFLGKGDENYQIVGNDFVPYKTDEKIILEFLSKIVEG